MATATAVRTFAEYLTVGEAAEFLGVSPWTLRNWDKSGKLKAARHPVSGYRFYRQEDLEALLQTDGLRGKRRRSLAPNLDWSEIGDTEHFVQLYEKDDFLVESVSTYVGRAIVAGEGAVIIATPAHRNRIHRKLRRRGFDLSAARQRGQYVALDAAETLSKFMAGDDPDPARFEDSIGAVIHQLTQRWPRVRAFGEMVSLLWSEGKPDAACQLEALWNDLAKRHSFALFCAYPINGFHHEAGGVSLSDVCDCHSRVIPAESYSRLATPAEQLRSIAEMQQKAQRLEAENALRKEAERELNQSDRDRAMLAAIVDSSQDAIISKTFDGIIRSWNAGAQRLFGYAESEAVGKPITLLIPPERLDEEKDILARLSRGERIEHYETVRVAKDGRRIDISLTISPLRDGRGNLIGASKIARDISDRKRAEEALREADRRKDEFLATLAHELRNPLAPIRNSLHILRMAGENGVPIESVLEMMERQVAQMVRLVDDLLELSRISRGKIELKRERIELTAVINQALETSRPLVEAGAHTLKVQLPAHPVMVQGDLIRLSQVFANLVNNAAKYTERGGTITVAVACEDGNAVTSVRDTGIGIPRDMLARVFETFVQVDNPLRRSQDGLGIGLSLVRSLVLMHGGHIEAHSDGLGLGSEFVVRLPIVERGPAGDAHASRSDRATAEARMGCRILVVDDNRDSANSLALMLRLVGADVQVAYDGRSALEAIKICRPSVILMDLGMPGMDGCEVARQIRQDPQHTGLTLIALTGWGQEGDRRRSQAAGFDHHLVKPVELSALQVLLAPGDDRGHAPRR